MRLTVLGQTKPAKTCGHTLRKSTLHVQWLQGNGCKATVLLSDMSEDAALNV